MSSSVQLAEPSIIYVVPTGRQVIVDYFPMLGPVIVEVPWLQPLILWQHRPPVAASVKSNGERRSSARSLLTTLLGEFVLPHGGTVWTTTAVSSLALLGIAERNARQALARVRDQNLIAPERHGRSVRWSLTPSGARLLSSGANRIYSFGWRSEPWDGKWLVVACPIPERERAKRHKLRTQLTFEGFGFIAPSIAVSPHRDREEVMNEILTRLGLADEAVTFIARTGTLTTDVNLIDRAWELEAIESGYRTFIKSFENIAPVTPEGAFTETIRLVDAWRRFPFRDPDLPAELLPTGWLSYRARDLFAQKRLEWSYEARRWYLAAEARRQSD